MPSDAHTAAARWLTVGFPADTVTPALKRQLDAGISGVILFKRNVPDPARVTELTRALRAAAGRRLLLSVDQEGGRVARLGAPYTAVPSMRAIGATGDPALARDAGTIIGAEMRAAGFDVVFAPVMDVDTNPANPVIADRSFGPTPNLVSTMGAAFIAGLQSTGIAACAKHFPGHGDTSQDSHHNLPRLSHTMERLEQIELPPFKAAIDANVAAVMSAHVIFTPLDPAYPATMSRPALAGILRDRFHFDGVIFSDDLEMKALADHYALEDQLLKGIEAGIDQFLICHTEAVQFRAIDILASAISRGTIPASRVQLTATRLQKLSATYARARTAPLRTTQASPAHQAATTRLAAIHTTLPTHDPTRFK